MDLYFRDEKGLPPILEAVKFYAAPAPGGWRWKWDAGIPRMSFREAAASYPEQVWDKSPLNFVRVDGTRYGWTNRIYVLRFEGTNHTSTLAVERSVYNDGIRDGGSMSRGGEMRPSDVFTFRKHLEPPIYGGRINTSPYKPAAREITKKQQICSSSRSYADFLALTDARLERFQFRFDHRFSPSALWVKIYSHPSGMQSWFAIHPYDEDFARAFITHCFQDCRGIPAATIRWRKGFAGYTSERVSGINLKSSIVQEALSCGDMVYLDETHFLGMIPVRETMNTLDGQRRIYNVGEYDYFLFENGRLQSVMFSQFPGMEDIWHLLWFAGMASRWERDDEYAGTYVQPKYGAEEF